MEFHNHGNCGLSGLFDLMERLPAPDRPGIALHCQGGQNGRIVPVEELPERSSRRSVRSGSIRRPRSRAAGSAITRICARGRRRGNDNSRHKRRIAGIYRVYIPVSGILAETLTRRASASEKPGEKEKFMDPLCDFGRRRACHHCRLTGAGRWLFSFTLRT